MGLGGATYRVRRRKGWEGSWVESDRCIRRLPNVLLPTPFLPGLNL